MSLRVRPHDLLRIDVTQMRKVLVSEHPDCSDAMEYCLRRAPWLVVRRALNKEGLIPVGVRGVERSQRFAAWFDPQGIAEILPPEALRTSSGTRDQPALMALQELERRWSGLLHAWGPTGSVGFELASGMATVTATSDLDLVLRARDRLSERELSGLAKDCSELACATDVQIETPHGSVALQEFHNTPSKLLLRTCSGPVLVCDPWQPPALWEMPA